MKECVPSCSDFAMQRIKKTKNNVHESTQDTKQIEKKKIGAFQMNLG